MDERNTLDTLKLNREQQQKKNTSEEQEIAFI